ncbi:hypothetical protein OIU77_026445 [Salix suchowensis]|uniref:Pentatricopeptide repeat-containing protein n=1 Tax=Salix suchowensis TaxID=1278906 RepID=A0ABQ9BL54_9ROSI|nr:hypothetical protein OIU77_026445 [Salix suchowensis]
MILSNSTKTHHLWRLTFSQQYRTLPFNKHEAEPRHRKKGHKTSSRNRYDAPFVNHVKEARDPDEALTLFHEYLQRGFKPDYPSYAALLYKLARCQDFGAVEEVLRNVEDNNVHCQETIFIALFHHYGKAQLVQKAVDLFNRMTRFNCVRTKQSLNGLLNVLVDNGWFLEANELFDRGYEMGFRLNSVAFNVMIKGWLEKGEWEQANKVFEEMLERKVEPSVVTYNSFIGYLCRNGELDKAKDLLEDMIKKGKRPNAITFALLMEGSCLIGEHNEAKKDDV